MAEKEEKISKKDRFEILLEDMNGKIDTILEGRVITDNKIDRLGQKADTNKAELEKMIVESNKTLRGVINGVEIKLSHRIEKVEQKVDVVDKKVDALDKKVDDIKTELKQDISKVDEKIDKLDEKMTDRQDTIEKKVDIVHQKVFLGH